MKKFTLIYLTLTTIFIVLAVFKMLFHIAPEIETLSHAFVFALLFGFIGLITFVLCYLVFNLIVETFKK